MRCISNINHSPTPTPATNVKNINIEIVKNEMLTIKKRGRPARSKTCNAPARTNTCDASTDTQAGIINNNSGINYTPDILDSTSNYYINNTTEDFKTIDEYLNSPGLKEYMTSPSLIW